MNTQLCTTAALPTVIVMSMLISTSSSRESVFLPYGCSAPQSMHHLVKASLRVSPIAPCVTVEKNPRNSMDEEKKVNLTKPLHTTFRFH